MVTSDFSISANPGTISVQQGAAGNSNIHTAVTSGTAQTVSLQVSGPAGVNATLTLRTYNGSIRSSFQLTSPSGDDAQKRNKRMTVTLGNGSAHVELESFGGTIALRRPGEPRPETERRGSGRGRGAMRHDRDDMAPDTLEDVIADSISDSIADSISDTISDSIEHAMRGAMMHAWPAPEIRVHPMPKPLPRIW